MKIFIRYSLFDCYLLIHLNSDVFFSYDENVITCAQSFYQQLNFNVNSFGVNENKGWDCEGCINQATTIYYIFSLVMTTDGIKH